MQPPPLQLQRPTKPELKRALSTLGENAPDTEEAKATTDVATAADEKPGATRSRPVQSTNSQSEPVY